MMRSPLSFESSGCGAVAPPIRHHETQVTAKLTQRLHALQIMDDFPRNAAGKTLKREMRDAYQVAAGDR